jgi:hypothetical protein
MYLCAVLQKEDAGNWNDFDWKGILPLLQWIRLVSIYESRYMDVGTCLIR